MPETLSLVKSCFPPESWHHLCHVSWETGVSHLIYSLSAATGPQEVYKKVFPRLIDGVKWAGLFYGVSHLIGGIVLTALPQAVC